MEKEHLIRDKSFAFAIRVVNLYKHLRTAKKEDVLSKQLLRSGTSTGANTHEAEHGQSRADYLSKMNIALKEAAETLYWLKLLQQTGYLTDQEFESMFRDCKELNAILAATVKTLKG